MTTQTVTVHLPSGLYEQVQHQAQAKNRSVEEEVVAAVETALTTADEWEGIPSDIAEEVSQLTFLDDEHLWRVARMSMSLEKSDRAQELVLKQQSEGLTEAEQEEVKLLQRLAHRVMLLRAEAAVLLKDRGFDISGLRQPQSSE